ncbi:uncharacterized protein LOC143049376 [Mytilus galloprovincialis]|uniref:uncharacterized protein LOC143049376 n=1 Tax=Mytilus galloprovincialis TaxID=29158 RepID=UPI003F7C29C9
MPIFNVLITVLAVVATVQSSGNIQTYRINANVQGGSINEDIVVDSVKHLMTVNVGDVQHLQSDCPSTINLHDFEKGKVAMKNIDTGECLVMDTKENLNATIDLLEKLTSLKMTHDIEEEKLVNVFPTTYDRLLDEAGEHIIEFCKGYELFYGEIINHQEVNSYKHRVKRRDKKKEKTKSGCSGFCFICKVSKQAQAGAAGAAGAPGSAH